MGHMAAGDGGHTPGVLALALGGHTPGVVAGSGSHSLGLLTGAVSSSLLPGREGYLEGIVDLTGGVSVVAGPSSLCRPQALL